MQVTIHTVTINALSQVLSSSDAAPADEPPTALIFGTVSAPSIIASYCDTIASFKCYGPYGFHLSCAVFLPHNGVVVKLPRRGDTEWPRHKQGRG